MSFTAATLKLQNYAWLLWSILFVSVVVGFGKEDVNFISTGAYLPTGIYQLIVYGMGITIGISSIINIIELYTNKHLMGTGTKIGLVIIILGLFILATRVYWVFFTSNVSMNIAPSTIIGTYMIAIGTASSSIGRMYDWRNYVKS